jgi:hypothetical protein
MRRDCSPRYFNPRTLDVRRRRAFTSVMGIESKHDGSAGTDVLAVSYGRMGNAAALRRQSLEMMDRAVAAIGTERLVLLAEALRLHSLARDAEGGSYPTIADSISPAASDASGEEAAPTPDP